MAMSFRLIIAPLALGLLAGCNTINPVSQSVDPGFGEAVKYDMAIQTIDPDPVYGPDGAQPGDHGEKGSEAVERYRTDAVKTVEEIRTGGVGGGGPQ
jgi:predicted small secreted protein